MQYHECDEWLKASLSSRLGDCSAWKPHSVRLNYSITAAERLLPMAADRGLAVLINGRS